MELRNKFVPGQRVRIGLGDIEATIERLTFSRDNPVPFYLVEWWADGGVRSHEFNERDLMPIGT